MSTAKNNVSQNVSIIPSVFSAETLPTARQLAAECFAEHAEMMRYLVLSNKELTSNKRDAGIESARVAKRRDYSGLGTYKHALSGIEFDINNNNTQGVYTGILDSALDQMFICFKKFGRRLLAYRVDLHMKDPEPDNKMVSQLLKKLNREVKKRFPRHKQLGYIWVAETGSKSNKKHYHLHLYLNGNCVRTAMYILPMLIELWEGIKAGNTVAPASYYKYITKVDQLKTAAYDMSYLAKSKDKGFQVRNANDYSTSRIKLAA